MSRRAPRYEVGGYTQAQRAARTHVACCLQGDVSCTRDAGHQQDPVVWGLLWRYWATHLGVAMLEESTTQWILALLLLRAPRATRSRIRERTERALHRGTHAAVERELLLHVAATIVDVELGDVGVPRAEHAVPEVWNEFCCSMCCDEPPFAQTSAFRRGLKLLRAATRVDALRVGWLECDADTPRASTRDRVA